MTTPAIKEKILDLEAQIALIKMSVFKKPNFGVDEKNWTKVRPVMKKIRAKVYKETYGKN